MPIKCLRDDDEREDGRGAGTGHPEYFGYLSDMDDREDGRRAGTGHPEYFGYLSDMDDREDGRRAERYFSERASSRGENGDENGVDEKIEAMGHGFRAVFAKILGLSRHITKNRLTAEELRTIVQKAILTVAAPQALSASGEAAISEPLEAMQETLDVFSFRNPIFMRRQLLFSILSLVKQIESQSPDKLKCKYFLHGQKGKQKILRIPQTPHRPDFLPGAFFHVVRTIKSGGKQKKTKEAIAANLTVTAVHEGQKGELYVTVDVVPKTEIRQAGTLLRVSSVPYLTVQLQQAVRGLTLSEAAEKEHYFSSRPDTAKDWNLNEKTLARKTPSDFLFDVFGKDRAGPDEVQDSPKGMAEPVAEAETNDDDIQSLLRLVPGHILKDEDQAAAIAMALTYPISLIHGPSGTGKTTVARELCRIWVNHLREKVLVLSHSNQGLDNLCMAISDAGVPIFRAGARGDAVHPRLSGNFLRQGLRTPRLTTKVRSITVDLGDGAHLFEDGIDDDDDEREYKRACGAFSARLKNRRNGLAQELLGNGGCVAATLNSFCVDSVLNEIDDFDCVIVDEASRADFHELLPAIFAAGKRVVFIGDHLQLGNMPLSDDDIRSLLTRHFSMEVMKRHLEEKMSGGLEWKDEPADENGKVRKGKRWEPVVKDIPFWDRHSLESKIADAEWMIKEDWKGIMALRQGSVDFSNLLDNLGILEKLLSPRLQELEFALRNFRVSKRDASTWGKTAAKLEGYVPTLEDINAFNAGFFEIAMKSRDFPSVMLRTNRRSKKEIVDVVNCGYDGKLKAGRGKGGKVLWLDTKKTWPIEKVEADGVRGGAGAVRFKKTSNHEKRVGTSYINSHEATVIAKQIARRLLAGEDPLKIGVTSPYSAQVSLIKKKLRRYLHEKPNLMDKISFQVATIDAFQGSEREVMYVSMVVSNTAGRIGFLNELRRLRVALSRAKEKLIIVGNSDSLIVVNPDEPSKAAFGRAYDTVKKVGEIRVLPRNEKTASRPGRRKGARRRKAETLAPASVEEVQASVVGEALALQPA